MTRATVDLAAMMLEDSARLQENGCVYLNRKEKPRGIGCLQPFYETRDARTIRRRFVGACYGDTIKVAPRVTASFHDVGHILGSAGIRLKYSARGNSTTILFSGDLGQSHMPILRDPVPPPMCDVLIIESTYGDRLHEKAGEALTQKAQDMVSHAKAKLSCRPLQLGGHRTWSYESNDWWPQANRSASNSYRLASRLKGHGRV